MKNNFRIIIIFAFFATFFMSMSYAENNYLFYLSTESATEVIGCPIDSDTGKSSGNCRGNYDAYQPIMVGKISAITTFRGDWSIIGDALGVLYAAGQTGITRCVVTDWAGYVSNCKQNPSVGYLKILRMAVDPFKWLYYISGSSLGVCKLEGIQARGNAGMFSDCHTIKTGLVNATGVAVSPDGKYLYITDRGTASVLICYVPNTGWLGGCQNYSNAQFVGPSGIVIDLKGKYAYVIDGQSPDGGLKSCELTNGGSTLGKCSSFQSAPGFTSGATSITLSEDGYYSYISYPKNHAIVKCSMISGEYKYCNALDLRFQSPQDLAYY